MGPSVEMAVDQVHRVMGHLAHLHTFGKCLVYELWTRGVDFEVLHPECEGSKVMDAPQRFQLLFPGNFLLEMVDTVEPCAQHRTSLRKNLVEQKVEFGILLCIHAAPGRKHLHVVSAA